MFQRLKPNRINLSKEQNIKLTTKTANKESAVSIRWKRLLGKIIMLILKLTAQ